MKFINAGKIKDVEDIKWDFVGEMQNSGPEAGNVAAFYQLHKRLELIEKFLQIRVKEEENK